MEDTSEKSWISLDSWTWTRALYLLAFGGMLFAYQSLLTLGTRWSLSHEVEYWLFRPGGNAPLVVIGLAGWLVYRRWWRLRTVPRQAGPLWLIVGSLVLGAGFYVWAVYTGAGDLKAVSLVFNAIGLIALHWGIPGLRALWLPVVFVLFCIQTPAPLLLAVIWKLQLWTADLAGWLLYLLGLPALVSGDLIVRASQTFQVIEGCSGLRSVEILTMLTLLLIDLFRRTGAHAIILVVLAPFVAFGLNGFRILTLILNPHSEIIAIHNLQGIAILLVGLLIIYFVDGLLERSPALERLSREKPPHGESKPSSATTPRVAMVVFVFVALLSVLAMHTVPVWQPPKFHRFPVAQALDDALQPWPSTDMEKQLFFWGSARFQQVVHQSRTLEDGEVTLWIAVADHGQRGGSAMSPKTKLPGSGWRVRERRAKDVGLHETLAEEYVIEKGKQRWLVHHWYQGTNGLPNEIVRSLFAIDRSWLQREEPMVVVRLSTPIHSRGEAGRAEASRRLDRVYERLAPMLEELSGLGGE